METESLADCAILLFMEDKLSRWLNAEIQARGWSIREVSRRAGLSHTAINNAMDGQSVRLETYEGIARAFGMQLEDVLRAAGVLPALPEPVEEETAILDIVRRLSPTARHHALAMLHGLSRLDSGEEGRGGGNPRGNNNHTNRHGPEEDWLERLSSLPRGAPDGQVRALTIERLAQLADDLTMTELRRLVWLFTSFRALRVEEREPTNSVVV